MTRNAPSNTDDVIDSRDVIARIEELEDDRQSLTDDRDAAQEELDDFDSDGEGEATDREELATALNDATDAVNEWDKGDEGEELRVLKELADEASGSPDWEYGETLIRDSYFKEYAQELAEDCGMVEHGNQWPGRCIDWEQAADELKMDYMSVDFDGVEYWIRA